MCGSGAGFRTILRRQFCLTSEGYSYVQDKAIGMCFFLTDATQIIIATISSSERANQPSTGPRRSWGSRSRRAVGSIAFATLASGQFESSGGWQDSYWVGMWKGRNESNRILYFGYILRNCHHWNGNFRILADNFPDFSTYTRVSRVLPTET